MGESATGDNAADAGAGPHDVGMLAQAWVRSDSPVAGTHKARSGGVGDPHTPSRHIPCMARLPRRRSDAHPEVDKDFVPQD
ncbi:hypothetical protein GCM10017771_44810 [Streptomyces capitiformicae]|uniref:Uncharacterized protein n=1 Tax=Streptomyces capitiformicae TaxID=2014920 RepID=A0A918YXZ7_9ACTN|nr:hypothetical protein GCM10017771_44810 [Streptomyces capitiformicae]